MEEKFELPIHIEDVDSVTDCWIYNRLAIIKNSPYYRDWIASHYNLYANSGYNFHFGNVGIYPPAYHEEILQRRPIRVLNFSPENIIENLKEYLTTGYYIIMHIKPYKQHDYFHEVLFYGFDDGKEVFLTVGLQDRIFQTLEFRYSYIEETLEEIQNYYLSNKNRGMELSLNYQYPATALRLNQSFRPDNCVFEAYLKLKQELNGEWHEIHGKSGFADYKNASYIYRGISCLDAFKQLLEKEIKGEKFGIWFRGITGAAKKMLEHRLMIKCSMEYILEKWNVAMTDNAHVSSKNYSNHISIIEKWVNLCLKYEFTKDKSLLEKVSEEIPKVFELERQCLNDFVNNGIDWELFNKSYI